MNKVDKQYTEIMQDIINNGVKKNTRSGDVLSVFGRTMRFDLKEGLPLLTTKKVFTKGVIHELLWFISGNTNIKPLVDNGVHIWDDDAYRYYKGLLQKNNNRPYATVKIAVWSKEDFIKKVKNNDSVHLYNNDIMYEYHYGDLGAVYGHQWRNWNNKVDQLKSIINTLQTNPNDRRMILTAWNVDDIEEGYLALPPCHTFYQFYTRQLSHDERLKIYGANHDTTISDSQLDTQGVPKYGLSCMQYCRSQDFCLGTAFNIISAALLTHMIAHVTNMIADELVWNGGDCHIYCDHLDGAKEQLNRKGSDVLAKLEFKRNVSSIDDFRYEDFSINDYHPDGLIKFPLSVGN